MRAIESARATENSTTARPGLDLCESFMAFIDDDTFPCVGAKAALARGAIQTHEFAVLGNHGNDQPMLDGLSEFVAIIEDEACDKDTVHSYVAIFRGPDDMSELRFEALLWSQLWRLHRLDVQAGNPAAKDVSNDTASPQFSLSVAEHPFFIIGLHAHASRLARRFSHPALVFNSHRQFEKLREDGRFGKMQTATRSRDVELQGSVNPNLADYGEESEARQYSGRKVEAGWKCPFDFRDQTL